ncbi:MAG: hypothetical protein R6V03_08895 [Kiritimatiellia bacterium]
MADIRVKKKENDSYEVTVEAGRTTTHTVTLTDEYHEKLTAGKISKEALIEKSFQFLLVRESNSSILSSFELPLIGHYFPEYEREISAS